MAKRTVRVGWYNVEFGHPKQAHAEMILHQFEAHRLDVLGLVEVNDYLSHLRKLVEPLGHQVISIHNRRGSDHVALLVRKGIPVEKYWTFIAGKPYFRKGGGKMAPTMPLAALIDDVLYVVVHAPVQAWVATHYGRKFSGPVRRRGAYMFYIARLIRLFRRHSKAQICVMGDWNATPDTRGKWSPKYLRDLVSGSFARPDESTGHGEIDFAVTRNIHATDCRVIPDVHGLARSDHKLVIAELVVNGRP